MKYFTILIFIFVSMISCRHVHHLPLRHVKVDSSFSKYGHDILEILPATTKTLNLPPISKGVDSFEFRFWLPGKMLDTMNILSIKYSSNRWESNLTKFVEVLPDYELIKGDTTNHLRMATIKFVHTSSITPDKDINLIIDTLSIFDLQNSPSNAKIEEGQALSTGGVRFILEFADKNNYRVLHYSRESRNSGLVAFDETFEQFLYFIKRHYKINLY